MGKGGGGRRERKFLSFSSLPFSLPSFPFSPETPDTQATSSSSERAKANNQNGFPRFAAVTNKDISQIIKQADLSVSRRSIICLSLRL